MPTRPYFLFIAVLLASASSLCVTTPTAAQDNPDAGAVPAVTGEQNPEPELTKEAVEAAMAEVEADASLEQAVKDLLTSQYKRALDILDEAEGFRTKAAEFKNSVTTAPAMAKELREQKNELPSADRASNVVAPFQLDALERDVSARRDALKEMEDRLATINESIIALSGRPLEISQRLPVAQSELSEFRAKLESSEFSATDLSPGRVAERTELLAKKVRVEAEIDMLEQEQVSRDERDELLKAQRDLLVREIENGKAALATLENELRGRLERKARQYQRDIADLVAKLDTGDRRVQEFVTQMTALGDEFAQVVTDLNNAKPARDKLKENLSELTVEYESIVQQMELGDGSVELAQLLFEMRSRVSASTIDNGDSSLPSLNDTHVNWLKTKRKISRDATIQAEWNDRIANNDPPDPEDALKKLLAFRTQLLDELNGQYAVLTDALADFENEQSQYTAKAKEVTDYIWQQLFWMRTAEPVSLKTFTDIPLGIQTIFNERWSDLRDDFVESAAVRPLLDILLATALVILILTRPRIKRALKDVSGLTRRVSSDKMSHTYWALLYTVLLALPLPIFIGWFAQALSGLPSPSGLSRDLGMSLQLAFYVSLFATFSIEFLRPYGLALAHFRWDQQLVPKLRRNIRLVAIAYIPMLLMVISYHDYNITSTFFYSVGRLSFIAAHVWIAFQGWKLMRSSRERIESAVRRQIDNPLTRSGFFWSCLFVGVPTALAIVSALGYMIAAVEFSLVIVGTLAIVVGIALLFNLSMRAFRIRQRRIAVAEEVERRKQLREAAVSEERGPASGEEVISIESYEEETLDVVSIGDQTKEFLVYSFGLLMVISVVFFWSGTFPLISFLEGITLVSGVSLLQLCQLLLTAAFVYVAMRNLPGLLELAVLRTTRFEAGTRHAISKICQYMVAAIGAFAAFQILSLDWAQFGWIAAALSVGLGFGMQEIVANFVCGLILLFEQPIRVGDVVTVDGTTGTVTKIQMRATTITNWDRQEYVVPNKNFITSALLNWTLSSSLNRVVIPVGVAYGSDTDKARQILLEVAEQNANVLAEPAPLASFEQFADSSLNLILRCFLPSMDNRLSTITELHAEIDRRFAQAGIEISFPQRDINLGSGWEILKQRRWMEEDENREQVAAGESQA